MIYLLVPIVVPIAVYWLTPYLVALFTNKRPARNRVLAIACVLYFISWYLPSPIIDGRNTSFTTHVIGGGVFSGLLWLYLKQQLKWHASPLLELLSLFVFVCTMGVVNELFELLIVQLKLVRRLTLTDTSWDLLANTLGMLLFWIGYTLFGKRKT